MQHRARNSAGNVINLAAASKRLSARYVTDSSFLTEKKKLRKKQKVNERFTETSQFCLSSFLHEAFSYQTSLVFIG